MFSLKEEGRDILNRTGGRGINPNLSSLGNVLEHTWESTSSVYIYTQGSITVNPPGGAGGGDGILCVCTRWAKMGLERGRILCAHQQPRFRQTGFPLEERSSEALRSWGWGGGYEDLEEEEPGRTRT